MRQIKFRAWDKESKKMSNTISLEQILKSSWNDFDIERIVIMQFTGLKDKNGKEIYEGDIVKATNKYNSTPTKRPAYEVIFEQGAFCGISLKRHSVSGKGLRTLKLKFDDWQEMETAEIIGNIYENPELLPVKE